MTMFNPDLVPVQPKGNAFMQQNDAPTQAGVMTKAPLQPQVVTGVPVTSPAETGGLFSGITNIDKTKGLGIAAVLAKLAEGYDKSIGGTGAMGSAVSDLAQSGLTARQQKKPTKTTFTPKGVKGETSRVTKEGANGERTVTVTSNDYDQLAGGGQAQTQPQYGQAFDGGQGLPPFEQPAGLEFIDVGTQLKLAELQQDPVGSVVTGDDGMQYGLTASGNMIPLNVGTMPKAAPAPKTKLIVEKQPDGTTKQRVIEMTPGQMFGAPPTADKVTPTRQRFYTKNGQRRAVEVDVGGKDVPGTDRAYDWKPSDKSGSGKDYTTDPKIALELQQLANKNIVGVGDDGKRFTGPQLDSNIAAYNEGAKRAKLPWRQKRLIVPPAAQKFWGSLGSTITGVAGFDTTPVKIDLVINIPTDKKGKVQKPNFKLIKESLVRDKALDPKEAEESALLYLVGKGQKFDAAFEEAVREKYKSVDGLYKELAAKKKKYSKQ